MGATATDGGGGGVPTWVIGVVINIIGATAINLGTNLMKLSHNDKQRRAQGQQLEDAEVDLSDAIHGRMNGTGSPPRQRHHVKARDTSDSDSDDRPRELPPLKTRLSDMWQRAIRRVLSHHRSSGVTAAGTQSSMAAMGEELLRWLRQKVWGVGMALFVGGNIANFISFAYAPQSMLAALGSVQFVSNVFCARFILGEEVTPRIVLGTVVIIVGQTLIVTFSTHQSADYDARGLMKLYDAEFLTYLGVLAIVGGSLSLVYQRYRVAEKRGTPLPYSEAVLPVSYAMPSAMLGTLSLLEAKSLSELLSATMRGDNQLKFLFTWVVLVLWVLLMVFWLNRMNTALRLFDGLMIIPLLQVFWTFFGLMVGGIFFKEFQTYTPKMLGLFCLGVATVFAGVYMLSPRHTDDEDFEELEEAPSDIADSSITTTDSLRALMAMQHHQQQLEESGSTAAVMRSSSGLSSVGRVSREHSGADMSVSDIGSASTRRRSLERRRSLDILEQREDTRLLGFGGMPFVASDNRFANFVDHLTPRVEELPDRSPASTRSGASLPRSGSLRPSHSGCGSFDAAVSATRDRPVYQHSRSQTWNVGPWNTQAAGGGERPPGDAPVGVTGPPTGVLRPLETHTHDATPHTPTLSSLPLPPLTGVTPDHGPTAAQPRYSSSSDLTMSTLALSPPAHTHAQTHTHTHTHDEGSEREGDGSEKDERMTRSLLRTDV